MIRKLALSLAVVCLPLSAAAADEPEKEARALGVETSIVFPSNSSIRNWVADRDRGVWIQDRSRNWYYGIFSGVCLEVDFAHVIGVDTRGTSRLDRFSNIIVRGERCPLSSFVTSSAPPSKKDKAAAKKTEETSEN